MKKIKTIYLVAGGNWRKAHTIVPVFKKILSETGKDAPNIAYIGTANGDDPSFFKFSERFFKGAGASDVTPVFLAKENADIAETKSILSKSEAIFVSGGDVEEGMLWLNRHKMVPFLKELYKKGALFFGLSAGSIMLGTGWVRWADPKDDASAGLFDCIGLAPVLCDTHAEKDKWEELKTAVKLLGKNSKGYGIPSGGVLCVAGDGTLTALDKPAVSYINQGNQVIKGMDIPVEEKSSQK